MQWAFRKALDRILYRDLPEDFVYADSRVVLGMSGMYVSVL
jgi:hypothetical protein